jgi:predicted transcriptional regulator
MMNSVIKQLRDLVPLRPLSTPDALRVADLQASRMLALLGVDGGPVPSSVIADLPRVQVELMTPAPVSGATQWSRGRWLVVLNGAEPETRRRYTLAHEAKHILDSPFIGFLYPGTKDQSTRDRAEQVCDYFAACLLMPKAWIKSAYFNDGIQDLRTLARRFEVSSTAMQIRLQQLCITDTIPRCLPPPRLLATSN